MKRATISFLSLFTFFISCSGTDSPATTDPVPTPAVGTLKYLALGDSYTIGESVCETCRFPEQLKTSLSVNLNKNISLEIIATTGWTTQNLLSALADQNPPSDQDLVTLLIGVNNQYQHKPFSVYETQFPELLNKAIALAKGDKTKVIVISIPDYAYTPFGQNSGNSATISTEIDQYNAFAENYAVQQGVRFVNITDITRQGLSNPELVAPDGLHPSKSAYAKFVEKILPVALMALPH